MLFEKVVNNSEYRKSENVSSLMKELNIYIIECSEKIDSDEKRQAIFDFKRWILSRK